MRLPAVLLALLLVPATLLSQDQTVRIHAATVIEGTGKSGVPDLRSGIEEARVLVAIGMKKRDAARAVGDRHGLAANQIYRALVARSGETVVG